LKSSLGKEKGRLLVLKGEGSSPLDRGKIRSWLLREQQSRLPLNVWSVIGYIEEKEETLIVV
jgi:hypothetical protein